ncbi:MAG: hypothetical protein FJX77_14820 [Armatimonadetes bacterium]|nr:hypothetical protein [Armatimonadota bacterium]
MRRITILVGLVLFLAAPSRAEFSATVTRIVDGDTFHVLRDGKDVTIQVHGIDAPELKQEFGTQAKKMLTDRLMGKTVRLVEKETDRFGRLVAQVYLDSTDVSAEMVRGGGAWAYVHFSKDYVAQEQEARKAKRGLWAAENPKAPWTWRKENARN